MAKKSGKSVKGSIDLASYEGFVADSTTFKTLQVRVGGWVQTNPDFGQHQYDRQVSLTKHKLKQMTRDWGRFQQYWREECIVDVMTSKVSKADRKQPYQYFYVDIVLFTQNDLKYDRAYVKVLTENFSHRIIDVLNQFPDTWSFVESVKRKRREQQSERV